ncbi:MAG TPA: DUF1707 domain-containing protein [Gemmatimonadales bacterium]|jgi:hypothetical protein|nr:DUF1707 domain-containing protein [Gemmatimonadales bacterium]
MTDYADPHGSSHRRPAAPPARAAPVGPAARDRVVDALTRHFASDQITEAEFEARLDRVYGATTELELADVIADLPVSVRSAAAPAVRDALHAGHRINALFSGIERKVTGLVPGELRVRAHLGYIELDLTGATFAPGLTAIDVRALMGYVQIRLPAGIRVESHGRALFGFFTSKGAQSPGADRSKSVVRITGRATFGFAEATAAS